jgi:hypothetical protein
MKLEVRREGKNPELDEIRFRLLALIVGIVCGDEINVRGTGVTVDESYSSTANN